LRPRLLSFDVFGTLIDTPSGQGAAFRSILEDAGAAHVDADAFWTHWEERNIAHYWEPYRPYKEICRLSLEETFERFGVPGGDGGLIQRYFDVYPRFELYPDVLPTLEVLGRQSRLALVSNIDDDLFAATKLGREFDLVCTAERARGYKPDGRLFRYLIDRAGVGIEEILHSGQSQLTDLVGGKPLGLRIAWINRRGLALRPTVPLPDFIFSGLASLLPLLADKPERI
jgi:2-haloacid dehalogenase